MSIETDKGYLDDIELEMVDISDHFECAIVRYEYPYVDGADLENLGEKASTVRIRCYFFDNAAQSTYDDHITLLNHLKGGGEHELLHPKYGLLKGMVESVDVRHDDRRRTAEVDLAFVKRGIDAIAPIGSSAVNALEGSFAAGELEQETEAGNDLEHSGLQWWLSYDIDLPLLDQVTGVSPQARGFARQIDSALGMLNGVANDITQPVNSLVATLNYTSSIPGRILGIVDRCVERVARLYDGSAKFPGRFLASVQFGLAKIERDLDTFLPADRGGAKKVVMKHVRLASSRRLALETASIYAADQGARRVQQSQGLTRAFDALGRYTPRITPDVVPMNVLELEATLAASRQMLQASIDEARSMHSLKEMALQLLTTVSEAKATAEQVISITVDQPTPLHLICLQYGLPYTAAERIMALNPTLRNPTFAQGELLIYRGAA